MENYSSLRKVAQVFKIFGWIQLIAGILIMIIQIISSYQEQTPVMAIIIVLGLTALVTFLAFIFCLAISELILMCINMANKIDNIDNNIYFLASKTEESIKN